MENEISPARMANAICQDKEFLGQHVFLEGKKDLRLFKRFIAMEHARIHVTFGKYKMREAYKLLNERGFSRKVGIRDADFLRIPGNNKFQEDYGDSIFVTDGHDTEIMAIDYGSLKNLLDLACDEERVVSFEAKVQKDIKSFVYSMAQPLAMLRLANKRSNLGLSFKPERPDGKRLKIEKFICTKTWKYLGNEPMINIVYEYSKNRGKEVSSRADILRALELHANNQYPESEILNGHDVSYIIQMVMKNGLNCRKNLAEDADSVEAFLSSYFDWLKFSKTKLHAKLMAWQQNLQTPVFGPDAPE